MRVVIGLETVRVEQRQSHRLCSADSGSTEFG